MFSTLKHLAVKYIDFRMATMGALLLGVIVFFVNYSHGILPASTAAAKQALYTFFVAGFVTGYGKVLAMKFDSALFSVIFAGLVAGAIGAGLTYFVHSLKGTPEPWLSTIPALIVGIPGMMGLAYKERYKGGENATESKVS